MYISRLDWDDYRIEHIAQHDLEPDEVWEVCEDPLHLACRQGGNRYLLYGQTADGRYLFVGECPFNRTHTGIGCDKLSASTRRSILKAEETNST